MICTSSKSGTYSKAYVSGEKTKNSDWTKDASATAETIITDKDKADKFDLGIDIRCRASNSNGEYALEDSSSETVTLRLEGAAGRVKDPNPPKVESMDIKIDTVPHVQSLEKSTTSRSVH